MFLTQAAAQFEIWTGERAPQAVMRDAVLEVLVGSASHDSRFRQPSNDMAQQGNIVPVSKALTADLETPVSAYLKLAARKQVLVSARKRRGRREDRPLHVPRGRPVSDRHRGGRSHRNPAAKAAPRERRGNLFEVLPELASQFRPAGGEGLPPLTAGAVGYIGYDLVRLVEPRVPPFRKNDVKTPDAVFLFFTTLLAFDHVKHQIHAIANVLVDEWKGKLEKGYQRRLPPHRGDRAGAGAPGAHSQERSRRAARSKSNRTSARSAIARRSRRPRNTFWPAIFSRSCSRSGSR